MSLLCVCLVIAGLYAKSINFNYNIDDNVPRSGYLNTVPETIPSLEFYNSKPPRIARVFNILLHCLNTAIVGHLFNWQTALLFGIHPISVNAAAWMTGNYYAVTTFFALTSVYFAQIVGGWAGIILAAVFYWAAMSSTITAVGLVVYYWFVNPILGALCTLVAAEYFLSKRFKQGVDNRHGSRDTISWRKVTVALKVFWYYTALALAPFKTGFFHTLGYDYDRNPKQREKVEAFDQNAILSICGLLLVGSVVAFVDYKYALWFAAFILPFGQYKVLGQFIAERYLYLPMIGLCAFLSFVLPTEMYWAYAGFLCYKTWLYIDSFRNIESLYKNSSEQFPDCPSGHCCLGSYYLQTDVPQAFPYLDKAIKADPDNFETNLNLSSYYIMAKHPDLAQQFCNKARKCYKNIEQPSLGMMLDNQDKVIMELRNGAKRQFAKV